MKIDKQILGGNIEVLEINGDRVRLANELRDTRPDRDWFYWAFRVTGAAGRTVIFEFPHKNRVGYWGVAVSHDQIHWSWTGNRKISALEDGTPLESFTYTFGAEENEVYFAHNMVYVPARFEQFCAKNGLSIEELCLSNKGRSVPFARFGKGEKKILLCSRHHACESTGTHVLESVFQSFIDEPLEGYEIVCVPFVDYDGVVDGDQGKHRLPHDHNRDYPRDGSESLYTTCAAIRRLADENPVEFAFDFHSPKHLGGIHDKVHIVYNTVESEPRMQRFSKILQSKLANCPITYDPANDIPPNAEWNKDTNADFARYLSKKPQNQIAFSLETPYFGEADGSVVINLDSMKELGKCFANALREYIRYVKKEGRMMKIDKEIVGGNIEVLEIDGDRVSLANELRDTRPDRDWFYWAFRVTGAAGRTVTFEFPHENRVGYWGAAVSCDQIHWSWTGNRAVSTLEDGTTLESFTYTFGADENETYFAHNMVYVPARFEQFCAKNGLQIEELCISNKGRSVPFTRFGKGEKKILLTSRHHACESTGTHVMESVFQSFIDEPLEGYEIVCVPFVDYDGVVEGDQGKHRLPHDHARDYPFDGSESIYTTCAAIRRLVDATAFRFAFDFHSPKHLGGIHDKVHIVYNTDEDQPRIQRFSKTLQSKITKESIAYDPANDWPANTEWNQSTNPAIAKYMARKPEICISFAMETPYFGEADGSVVTTLNSMRELGKSFAVALREYIQELGE